MRRHPLRDLRVLLVERINAWCDRIEAMPGDGTWRGWWDRWFR